MLGKLKGKGRVWGKEGLSLVVSTAEGGMCSRVRSRCEVEVRAGQRPQELGSLREELAKGSLCHLLPTHPRLWVTKRAAFLGLAGGIC